MRSLSLAPLLLLCMGASCGGYLARARVGEKTVDFTDKLSVALHDMEEHPTLVACALEDPLPHAVDDEQSLCLTLQLAPGALDTLKAGDTVTFRGEAKFPEDAWGTPSYTPDAEQSPTATAAWAILSAFCPPRTDGPTQQVEGQLVVSRLTAQQLAGRVEMKVDGQLGGAGCSQSAGPAELAFVFEVSR